MGYSEKLKDPRWQKVRLQILSEADFKCEWCWDTKATLHVHHFYYEKGKDPWDYPRDCLICICDKCHELYHLKNIPKPIDETMCLFASNPEKYGEALRILVAYTLEYYRNR